MFCSHLYIFPFLYLTKDRSSIFLMFLFVYTISYEERFVLKSHMQRGFSVPFFSSVNFCFMYFEALIWEHGLYIVISFFWVDPFIIIKYISLFLISLLNLKSNLSVFGIVSPILFCLLCIWYIFLYF